MRNLIELLLSMLEEDNGNGETGNWGTIIIVLALGAMILAFMLATGGFE